MKLFWTELSPEIATGDLVFLSICRLWSLSIAPSHQLGKGAHQRGSHSNRLNFNWNSDALINNRLATVGCVPTHFGGHSGTFTVCLDYYTLGQL